MKSKLKGRKIPYQDRWHRDELRPAVALQGIAVVGPKLRKLIAEIHREHRTRRPDPKEDAQMPVYAALTPGDPPQMEFVPFGSNHKHPKIIAGYEIFKFANKALFAEAIPIAEKERGFGLFLITRKDFGTRYTPHNIKTIEGFRESLDISGWCAPCKQFSYGVRADGKCWRCKKPTQ